MLWLDPSSLGFTISDLAQRAKTRGLTLGSNRIVVHHQVTREAVDDLIQLVADMKAEYADKPKREIDQAQNEMYARGEYTSAIQPPIARLGTSYGKVRRSLPLSLLFFFGSRRSDPDIVLPLVHARRTSRCAPRRKKPPARRRTFPFPASLSPSLSRLSRASSSSCIYLPAPRPSPTSPFTSRSHL